MKEFEDNELENEEIKAAAEAKSYEELSKILSNILHENLVRFEIEEEPIGALAEVLAKNLAARTVMELIESKNALKETVTRRVCVDGTKTITELINGSGRRKSIDDHIVDNIPKPNLIKTKLYFFKGKNEVFGDSIELEYKKRGLKPANPFLLLFLNSMYPGFFDLHPSITYWENEKDRMCFMKIFTNSHGEKWIDIHEEILDKKVLCISKDLIWFVGVREF